MTVQIYYQIRLVEVFCKEKTINKIGKNSFPFTACRAKVQTEIPQTLLMPNNEHHRILLSYVWRYISGQITMRWIV